MALGNGDHKRPLPELTAAGAEVGLPDRVFSSLRGDICKGAGPGHTASKSTGQLTVINCLQLLCAHADWHGHHRTTGRTALHSVWYQQNSSVEDGAPGEDLSVFTGLKRKIWPKEGPFIHSRVHNLSASDILLKSPHIARVPALCAMRAVSSGNGRSVVLKLLQMRSQPSLPHQGRATAQHRGELNCPASVLSIMFSPAGLLDS
jgi:hypothetical protein